MEQILSISKAREQLPSLLKAIQENPRLTFAIKVRNDVVATLSAARPSPRKGAAVRSLLLLANSAEKKGKPNSSKQAVHSENFKNFLYGK